MFEYAPCEEKLIQVSKAIGGVYEMNAVATRSIARDLAALLFQYWVPPSWLEK